MITVHFSGNLNLFNLLYSIWQFTLFLFTWNNYYLNNLYMVEPRADI